MPLGPADYRVVLCRRGGEEVADIPWVDMGWGRGVDEMTTGNVRLPPVRSGSALARLLSDVVPWRDELAIHRGGKLVWAGPLIEPEWGDEEIVLSARDVFQWFERRTLWRDHSHVDVDLAVIFGDYAADALEQDPSPNIAVIPTPTRVNGTRTVLASTKARAADKLRELARDGLDFTVVGRAIIVGGEEVPAQTLPPITNDVLASPRVRLAGLEGASKVALVGASSGVSGQPIVGVAGGVGGLTGLVERVFSESDIEDVPSAEAGALTRLQMVSGSPTYLTGDLKARGAPTMDRLVPGAVGHVDVTTRTGRRVNQYMRLSRVAVRASAGGEGAVSETVSVELIPLGTTEAA